MLKINEIFYSLQGEGARAGTANIFIRFAGCDLTCGFCDTEFESYKDYGLYGLYERIKDIPCKNIIWTGGEPALQLTDDIVNYFNDRGYKQAIETNGNHRLPRGLNYVVVSPKVAEHVVAKNFKRVDELRYARGKNQGIPQPSIDAYYKFISPIFDGQNGTKENIEHCIKLVKENPEWRLSIQLHKLLQIR